MQGLTEKQQNIFNFLTSFAKKYGYPPTVKEIMEEFNFASPTAVTTHLQALEKKGYLRKTGKRARGSVPINFDEDKLENTVSIPLLASGVKAGFNMSVSDETIEDTYIFSRSIVNDDNSFLMRVEGDSMIEAHIKNGDLAVVKPQTDALNGDIVVAVIDSDDGETITVKRFFKEINHIKLISENKKYEPIILESVRIVGKVTGIIRLNI